MASRNRSRRPRNAGKSARPPWPTTVVLAVPLMAGTAAVAVTLAEAAPAAADASTAPRARASLLPSLPGLPLPTPSLPSIPLPTPSLPLPLPSLPGLPLPTQPGTPSQPGTPAPTQSAAPRPTSGSGTSSGRAGGGHRAGTRPGLASPAPSAAPVPMPWAAAASPPVVSSLPSKAVGYALPVPLSLVTAHPALIGADTALTGASAKARPAGPVTLAVPRGTPVSAVTEGTLKVIPAGDGTSAIVLSGADGATYTYRNVVAAPGTSPAPGASPGARTTPGARADKVKAGARLGTAGPGGLTFAVSVPDVRGPVDADEAMQAWASGLSVDVRSLPSTTAAVTKPVRDQVLLVTGPAGTAGPAGTVGGALAKSLSSALLQVRTATLAAADPLSAAAAPRSANRSANRSATRSGQASPVARRITASGGPELVIVALADGTPAQAARLAALLPAGHRMLWVAPAGTTPKQAAAYRSLVASRPGFRVESLPSALKPAKGAPAGLSAADQLAAATLAATYATTAYRLYSAPSEADVVLGWAERQLGKPYQWAAAGPDSFDCSGLTMDALAQAGIVVPHNANSQWRQTKAQPVAENKLAAGDLVFFPGSDGTRAAPGHVGIYVGDGQIIDAPQRGAPVRFDSLKAIGGYTGSTDPYFLVPSSAGGTWAAAAQLAGLAVPATLSQYQAFARQLSDSTWGPGQFPSLYLLWQRESGWNPAALNPVSGAFGIPQSLPAAKMASAGMDWASDPYTQIIWGIGYIRAAYGDPRAAWAHELAYNWY